MVSFWIKDVDDTNNWQLIMDTKEAYKLLVVNEIRKYIRMVAEQNG